MSGMSGTAGAAGGVNNGNHTSRSGVTNSSAVGSTSVDLVPGERTPKDQVIPAAPRGEALGGNRVVAHRGPRGGRRPLGQIPVEMALAEGGEGDAFLIGPADELAQRHVL